MHDTHTNDIHFGIMYSGFTGVPRQFWGPKAKYSVAPPLNVKVLAFISMVLLGAPLSLGPGQIAPFGPPSPLNSLGKSMMYVLLFTIF